MVNPTAFADSVIVSWITEMRKEKEKLLEECECEGHVCRWIEHEVNEFRLRMLRLRKDDSCHAGDGCEGRREFD